MKSRVSDQASGPSVGTFSTPSFSFGSGSSPAGPAISRAASAIERCEASWDDCATARRSASASESAPSAAPASDGGSSVTPMTAKAADRRRPRIQDERGRAAAGKTRCDDMRPPPTR